MRWNLGLAGLASAWGLIAVIASAVPVGAVPLALFRLAFAAVTLLLISLVGGRLQQLRPGPHLPTLVALGLVQAVHWLLFFETVKRGSVALAVLTFYTAPLFLAVLAPLLLPEKLSNIALGALVPGGIGIVLVAAAGDDGGGTFGWLALACGMGSALTFAILLVLSKRLLHARAAPLTVAFWDCLVGAVVLAPVLAVADGAMPADGREWGAVALLGVVFTGIATLVYAFLLRHTTAQAAGVITFLEPVAAIVLAWSLLDEPLSGQALIGGALVVLAGIAVVALEPTEPHVTAAVTAIGSTER